jgi:hypothetical protein
MASFWMIREPVVLSPTMFDRPLNWQVTYLGSIVKIPLVLNDTKPFTALISKLSA